MTKTKPVHLKKGDLVSLVAPSGPIADTQRLETAKLAVEKLGLRTKVSTHAADRYGYLAGDDATRAQEFTEAFADTETKAVICLKGGYGAQRILARLDFGVICRNPKILLGYSDITALHVALSQVCHLVTFHGPMPSSDMIPEMDNWTETSLRRAIFSTDPLGAIGNPDDSRMLDTLVPGRARGELVGGNLSLLASGLGTPWEIDTRGKILFLEDVDEAPYRVDRMLNQLKLAGKLDECAGIVLGMWTRCVAPEGKPSLELGEVFRDIVAPSRKPTLVGLQAGHCAPNLVLPFGIQYELCTDEGRLEALEPACI